MGDHLLEKAFTLTLKNHFFRPNEYEAPIENAFYIGRTMADILDKHYALFAQNQHPLQIALYESHNQFLRKINDPNETAKDDAETQRFKEVEAEREAHLNTEEGESLTLDDLSDIYIQVKGEFREAEKFQVRSKDKQGNINDYLETRRPFGAGQ